MVAGTLQENAQVEMEGDVSATTATNLATSRRLAPTEVEVVVEIIETVITGITEEAAIETDITAIREITRIITQEEIPTEVLIDLPVGQIEKETFLQYRRGLSDLLCLESRTLWGWTPLSLLNHQSAANLFRSPDGWTK